MKYNEFKPNAQEFFNLIGKGNYISDGIANSSGEEYSIYSELPYVSKKSEPLSNDLADVLKRCMQDYPNSYLSEEISRLLLTKGFQDAEVISHLSAWNKMFFTWEQLDMTANKLTSIVESAGIDNNLLSNKWCLDKMQEFLKNPIGAIGTEVDVLGLIFSGRWYGCSLKNDAGDEISDMFLGLFNSLNAENKIEKIEVICNSYSQEYEPFEQLAEDSQHDEKEVLEAYHAGNLILRFLYNQKTYVMYFEDNWSDINSNEMMSNFDAFMFSIGRDERVFKLKIHELEYGGTAGHFVVAEPNKFANLMQTLNFSAARSNDEIKPTIYQTNIFEIVV
jgi:hypothetical protein